MSELLLAYLPTVDEVLSTGCVCRAQRVDVSVYGTIWHRERVLWVLGTALPRGIIYYRFVGTFFSLHLFALFFLFTY